MTLFVVEHRLRDVGEDHLAALRSALEEITGRMSLAGDEAIRYVRSTVVSGQGRCICLFVASSEGLVRRANELAQVPVASIATAIDYEIGASSADDPISEETT